MVPIRCFSCGKPVAQYWDDYKNGLKKGKKSKELLDSFGLDRFCCRQTMIAHADIIGQVAQFKV
ncbi:MAG: DNA-directed RNA polymerase subunit N [Candidatus Aenigmatarchaeota archaeon]|nr:MAG: DNA-directed RNA polymerase subunit N [Candidatus Aenigmarchaeota archaeon]